ncbi:MAG TPA: T9SS type A sorting domain-containing protein [Bacteroidia bacterium]|nr:T9SS type A sorting domain-containing protein [Bacteroidia bacterium]
MYNAINSPRIIFKDNCRTNNNANRLANTTNINTVSMTSGFDAYVYPNPNSGKEIFIAPIGLTNGNLQIKVSDLEGRTVVENNCAVTDGLSNLKMSNINNGVYFVHITNIITGEHIVKKIVIQY